MYQRQQQHDQQITIPIALQQPSTPSILTPPTLPTIFMDQWNEFNDKDQENNTTDNLQIDIVDMDESKNNNSSATNPSPTNTDENHPIKIPTLGIIETNKET